MPYEITQCYLPPDRGDFPAFTPAEAGVKAFVRHSLAYLSVQKLLVGADPFYLKF